MNALELLKRDHDVITSLLTAPSTYAEKKRAFEQIKNELETHAYLEETFFYPILESQELLKNLVDDARAQHRLMRELLRDLEKQEGAEFEKNFQTLKAEAQLHFTAEENEIFAQISRVKTESDLGRLGERLANDKKARQSTHVAPA